MKPETPKPGEPFSPSQRPPYAYAKCPRGLLRDRTLSIGARLLWMILADCEGPDGCFPGHAFLAGAVGTSVETIKRLLRELREAGLVRIGHPESGPDRRRNQYIFTWQDTLNNGSELTPINKNNGSGVTPGLPKHGSELTPNQGNQGSDTTPIGEIKGSNLNEIGVKSALALKEDQALKIKRKSARQIGGARLSPKPVSSGADYPVLQSPKRPEGCDVA